MSRPQSSNSERPRGPFPALFLVVLLTLLGVSLSATCNLGGLFRDNPRRVTPQTFYVAMDGNDRYNGLAPAHQGRSRGPFRTLNRAARAVQAGDTVLIRGGTYQEATIWDAQGTEDAPITITNFESEPVVIDGNKQALPTRPFGALLLIKGNWYKISNLEIGHSGYYGLTATGEHATLDNIYCHHSFAAGITTTGSYALVQNCRAWYNSTRHEFGRGDRWSTGISIQGGGPHSVIRRCTAWENWGQGIKAGTCSYATIEDCTAYDNMFNFYIKNAQHTLFQRNLAYMTPQSAISRHLQTQTAILIGDEAREPRSKDNTFVNNIALGGRYVVSIGSDVFEDGLCAYNTFVGGSEGPSDSEFTVRINRGTYRNARFENNIVLQAGAATIASNQSSGIEFGHNCWSGTPPENVRGAGDVIGDPLLARKGAVVPGSLTPEWFMIGGDSPARDRAKALSEVTADFFGTARGTPADIGAHEIPDPARPAVPADRPKK